MNRFGDKFELDVCWIYAFWFNKVSPKDFILRWFNVFRFSYFNMNIDIIFKKNDFFAAYLLLIAKNFLKKSLLKVIIQN